MDELDYSHPKKSILLTAIVEGAIKSVCLITSQPLYIASIKMLHSQRPAAEWQGEFTEMGNAIKALTWTSAWKGLGCAMLGAFSSHVTYTLVTKYWQWSFREAGMSAEFKRKFN